VDLPFDVMFQIFLHLDDLRDVCALSRLNKSWNKVACDDKLWKEYTFRKEYFKWLPSLPKSNKQDTSNWKNLFFAKCTKLCVDCEAETTDKMFGDLQMPLCCDCREGYAVSKASQHFVTRTKAKSGRNFQLSWPTFCRFWAQ